MYMSTEKEWLRFPATIRKDNRITVPPTIMKALKLKKGDRVNLQIREIAPGEGE